MALGLTALAPVPAAPSRNPFRDPTLRREFDAAVQAYRLRHRDLFIDGKRRSNTDRTIGSSFAQMFWNGYDNIQMGGGFIDAASRQMLGYADYRAGQFCRKHEPLPA